MRLNYQHLYKGLFDSHLTFFPDVFKVQLKVMIVALLLWPAAAAIDHLVGD
jgi:hypothetical protein